MANMPAINASCHTLKRHKGERGCLLDLLTSFAPGSSVTGPGMLPHWLLGRAPALYLWQLISGKKRQVVLLRLKGNERIRLDFLNNHDLLRYAQAQPSD